MLCQISLPQFEGPLELLLSLIEDRKLDITTVSLGAVADQYLERLSSERNSISLENLAGFLVIAARLILIKSKMLLPVLVFTEEEESSMEDLEERLREYRRFKEAALVLGGLQGGGDRCFSREKFFGMSDKEVYGAPKGISSSLLRTQFIGILGAAPKQEVYVEESLEEIISLEERIDVLRASLKRRMECTFHSMIASTESRLDLIVSFLAMLELVKQRVVSVKQSDVFGDIHISLAESQRVS